MVKAMALTKGYELDGLLSKGKDEVLDILFGGGVIRGKKLSRGSVYIFEDALNQKKEGQENTTKENPNAPSAQQILKAYETVYLFQWLFPEDKVNEQKNGSKHNKKQPKFQKFKEAFKLQSDTKLSYLDLFDNIDSYIEPVI